MTRFLLDTNAAANCIFRRRGVHERVREARINGSAIGIAIPVLAELLAGIENSQSREKNIVIVNHHLRLFRVWPFTIAAARIYAQTFAHMRQTGRPKAAIDLMIAATALSLGNCTVITSDSDFAGIPGLNIADWSS